MPLSDTEREEVVDGLVLAANELVPGGLKERELLMLTAFATALVLSGAVGHEVRDSTT